MTHRGFISAHLTLGHIGGYIGSVDFVSEPLGPSMSQDHATTLPPIPFTDHDYATMRTEDVGAAKTIAMLTCGIFGIGLILYSVVLVSVFVQTLIYTSR
jgi:hypothetical protein